MWLDDFFSVDHSLSYSFGLISSPEYSFESAGLSATETPRKTAKMGFYCPQSDLGRIVEEIKFSWISTESGIVVSRFLFGVITGVIMMYVASHYHVVRGNDGFYLVPKLKYNLQEVYVDTREFDPDDWLDHQNVAAAILQSNQTHLLGESTLNPLQESVQSIFSNLVPRR